MPTCSSKAWGGCKEPRYAVPLAGHRTPSGEQVMFEFAFCKAHAQDVLADDWLYCPNCASCGIGGCCPHSCWLCKDRWQE